MNCASCSKETSNPKFCSRSCSATVTNRTPKRKRSAQSICVCGQTKSKRANRCSDCFTNRNTIATIQDWLYINPKVPQSLYGRIRVHARYLTRHLPKLCSQCGYSNHVQVAHIKGINTFSRDTLISVVNNLDNLAFLCPNHHWELDHGMLAKVNSLCL